MSETIQKLVKMMRGGKAALGTWTMLADPMAAMLLMQEDFDTTILDMQHGTMDYAAATTAIALMAAVGKAAIVRIPVEDYALASRVVDAGAAAVIAPMINNADDARRLVNAIKYPPIGQRSWGPGAALALSGMQPADYFRSANEFTLTFAMLETKAAFANIDEILAVPGLDGVFVGPVDLSIALSDGKVMDALSPLVTEALGIADAKTRATGKLLGAFAPTLERAREHIRDGFELVTFAGDTRLMTAGARDAVALVRK